MLSRLNVPHILNVSQNCMRSPEDYMFRTFLKFLLSNCSSSLIVSPKCSKELRVITYKGSRSIFQLFECSQYVAAGFSNI
jgi:hypothetical protein